jgi:hypothetical protein
MAARFASVEPTHRFFDIIEGRMFYKSFPEFQSLIITVALHYIVLS